MGTLISPQFMSMGHDDSIDFLIIGAQKCGTTSLFRYMREHPQIYMPTEKEVDFFQDDKRVSKGMSWYVQTYFRGAGDSMVKGEVSPRYMMCEKVPERIFRLVPKVKLIAILRNPIDRAYSHYRMTVRQGRESRSFAECVTEAMGFRKASKKGLDHYRDYVPIGEYGRILGDYRKCFSQDQIRVVFTEDLEKDASGVLKQLYEYLAVDSEFISPNIEKKFHVGGVERIPGLNAWIGKKVRWGMDQRWGWRWKNNRRIEHFLFWLKTQGNVKPVHVEGPALAVRERLRAYYQNDVSKLQTEFDVRAPWRDFCDE